MKKYRLMLIAAALFAIGSAFTTTKKEDCGYVLVGTQWEQQEYGVDFNCDDTKPQVCSYNEFHEPCQEGEYIPIIK